MDPIISVLMPVYNAGPYLKESIESILNQTVTDFEFLIFNDASTDNSLEIILSYQDPRIQVFDSPENCGYVKHLNDGIDLARGKYIARMDADDISIADRFEKQLKLLEENLEIGVCATNYVQFGESSNKIIHPQDNDLIKIFLLSGCYVAHPSVMIRTSILSQNNIVLRYDHDKIPAEDYCFWVNLISFSKFHNLQEFLLKYRIHKSQISSDKAHSQMKFANEARSIHYSKIGISPTLEEMKLTDKILCNNFEDVDHIELELWIIKVLTSNKKYEYFNQDLLTKIFKNYWLSLIMSRKFDDTTEVFNKDLTELLFKDKSEYFKTKTKFLVSNLIRNYRYKRDNLKSREFNELFKESIIDLYCKWLYALYRIGIYKYRNIPIVINNFNRLTYLEILVDNLQAKGYKNIIILDNQSTYKPLLDFYRECEYEVVFLGKNLGHTALWNSKIFKRIKYNFFVYTDSDMVPIEECPSSFMNFFLKNLMRYSSVRKIGFGLKIDDLPDSFQLKERVLEHETMFWLNENKINRHFFNAAIDTTFALYKPFSKPLNDFPPSLKAYRSNYPFVAKHLPWYEDSQNLNEEQLFYNKTANKSASWTKELLGEEHDSEYK